MRKATIKRILGYVVGSALLIRGCLAVADDASFSGGFIIGTGMFLIGSASGFVDWLLD